MKELIYLSDSESRDPIIKIILAKWPDAKFEDASDFIHRNRFTVEISDVQPREFFALAVREGFAMCCFGIQIDLYNPPAWMREEAELLRDFTE